MSEWRPLCGEIDESPDVAGAVICRKKLFGGRPSLGTCNQCGLNPAKGTMPAAAVVQVRVPTAEHIAWANEARNLVFRGLWREIHLASLSPEGLTETKLADVLRRMPCGSCVTDFNAIRDGESFPVRFPETVGWHNAVNATLGKPLLTVDEARTMYA